MEASLSFTRWNLWISVQGVSNHIGVPTVVFGARNRMTIPESIHLLGVEWEDGETSFDHGFDHGSMRGFDADGDRRGAVVRKFD